MMRFPNIIIEVARKLRNEMTLSEFLLWNELKDKKIGVKFLRQRPFYIYTENS